MASLVLASGTYGSELVPVDRGSMTRLDTQIVRSLWGPTRTARAREIVLWILHPGHIVSAEGRRAYLQLLWLARIARMPGALQVAVQALWEARVPGQAAGPAGRAWATLEGLGWTTEEWWVWKLPHMGEPLNVTRGAWGPLLHEVREGLRVHHMGVLEARRPRIFQGVAGGVARRRVGGGPSRQG